ncbi:MAG: ferritin-like domain-containing protein [Solirubrobacterales bacterium]|nr:ferritin-like domain-containing protein [Solirubrobacterales bacterium]
MDLKILQYALTLEYLGAAFYESALRHARLSGEAHEIALTFRGHERAHVGFVSQVIRSLGGRPHAPEKFVFGSATRSRQAFLKTSAKIEEMCVETLNGARPPVSKPVLMGAGELVSVEARQASWVRTVLSVDPAPFAFNPDLTMRSRWRA